MPSSDIDVLRYSERIEEIRTEILGGIYRELGYMHPFEIHLVDGKELHWYKKFELKKI